MNKETLTPINIENLFQSFIKYRSKPTLLIISNNLDSQTVLEIFDIVKQSSIPEMDIILHAGSGNIQNLFSISKMLKTYIDKINLIIPMYAKGNSSLLAFCAEQILMSELSYVGPILLDKRVDDVDDDRDLMSWRKYAEILLTRFRKLELKTVQQILFDLLNNYPISRFAFDTFELKKIGLPASGLSLEENKLLADFISAASGVHFREENSMRLIKLVMPQVDYQLAPLAEPSVPTNKSGQIGSLDLLDLKEINARG